MNSLCSSLSLCSLGIQEWIKAKALSAVYEQILKQ